MTEAGFRLQQFAAAASIELTPRDAGRMAELGSLLPQSSPIYLTALPGADPGSLVPAAVAVREAGHTPVPHVAARGLHDLDEVDALIGRLVAEAEVDDVLVVAGGVKQPVGQLDSSLPVLESGLLERHGIRRIGVAGHPEGSPDIPAGAAREAIVRKNELAAGSSAEWRIVTQFALAAEPYIAYERELREAGNRLPITAGLPGVTSPPRLLKFALACGIGPSIEVLRKQSGGLLKLATTRSWRPDAIAAEIAQSTVDDPGSLIAGIHLFPFGGVEESAGWLAEMRTPQAAAPA